ncbi:hypothetical protein [Geodermatophilus sp. TF02-6]|uniref:hypothetical protein n=1 Tax=Geodermatophilus sp. TF02-6 TaxID=2250575 RepID=UPI001314E405|nr:hypothetical protein [Geodermatophilus sp. TF02-6]
MPTTVRERQPGGAGAPGDRLWAAGGDPVDVLWGAAGALDGAPDDVVSALTSDEWSGP